MKRPEEVKVEFTIQWVADVPFVDNYIDNGIFV